MRPAIRRTTMTEIPQRSTTCYRVQTGLMELIVDAASPTEAIVIAREQLCLELPRLWDVIQAIPERFDVELEQAASESRPSETKDTLSSEAA